MRTSASPGCSAPSSTVSIVSFSFGRCSTAARNLIERTSSEADAARVVVAGDAGAAVEDAGVAPGDLLVQRQHGGFEIGGRSRLRREMTVAILAAHQRCA